MKWGSHCVIVCRDLYVKDMCIVHGLINYEDTKAFVWQTDRTIAAPFWGIVSFFEVFWRWYSIWIQELTKCLERISKDPLTLQGTIFVVLSWKYESQVLLKFNIIPFENMFFLVLKQNGCIYSTVVKYFSPKYHNSKQSIKILLGRIFSWY